MNTYPDDTFLARWLNGELTPEELAEFEQSEDHAKLTQVMEAMNGLQSHPFDGKRVLGEVKAKIAAEKEQKIVDIRRGRKQIGFLAAAVIVVLIVGTWFFTRKTTDIPSQTYATTLGEQQTETFADGTKIILNSESTMEVAIADAVQDRSVKLQGEAYFEVAKGNRFAVETPLGEVLVVGTAFNVAAIDSNFKVTCYEGKVSVHISGVGEEHLLTVGQQIVFSPFSKSSLRNERNLPDAPTWTASGTQLENISYAALIDSMQNKFRITIETPPTFDDEYEWEVASFSHTDISTALNTSPISLDYAWEILWEERKVVLKKKE
ncbi:MAG: FecR domain-containing protein [Bacteroidota bacterium]